MSSGIHFMLFNWCFWLALLWQLTAVQVRTPAAFPPHDPPPGWHGDLIEALSLFPLLVWLLLQQPRHDERDPLYNGGVGQLLLD
jgi:hypothetical protein